ncbi:unnamed protein product [Polarella glacialis]|uniref:RING-type domain-containing protein n=1 Tax=Polarella glacialis TaxID=89957 RepID=A0A813LA38_POLGL|nr:unnamed protein product [Polarella glacialis]
MVLTRECLTPSPSQRMSITQWQRIFIPVISAGSSSSTSTTPEQRPAGPRAIRDMERDVASREDRLNVRERNATSSREDRLNVREDRLNVREAAFNIMERDVTSRQAALNLKEAEMEGDAKQLGALSASLKLGEALLKGDSEQLRALSASRLLELGSELLEGLKGVQGEQHRRSEQHASSIALKCLVCMSEPKCIMVQPCNHVSFCATCASPQHTHCPICRAPVEGLIKIFL